MLIPFLVRTALEESLKTEERSLNVDKKGVAVTGHGSPRSFRNNDQRPSSVQEDQGLALEVETERVDEVGPPEGQSSLKAVVVEGLQPNETKFVDVNEGSATTGHRVQDILEEQDNSFKVDKTSCDKDERENKPRSATLPNDHRTSQDRMHAGSSGSSTFALQEEVTTKIPDDQRFSRDRMATGSVGSAEVAYKAEVTDKIPDDQKINWDLMPTESSGSPEVVLGAKVPTTKIPDGKKLNLAQLLMAKGTTTEIPDDQKISMGQLLAVMAKMPTVSSGSSEVASDVTSAAALVLAEGSTIDTHIFEERVNVVMDRMAQGLGKSSFQHWRLSESGSPDPTLDLTWICFGFQAASSSYAGMSYTFPHAFRLSKWAISCRSDVGSSGDDRKQDPR